MISKEMYELLKKIPRHNTGIAYTLINPNDDEIICSLVCEAKSQYCGYVNEPMGALKRSCISLTEKGQAAIEEYERTAHNQEMVEKSLNVSRIAMWAAIGSAIAAIASLIKLLV